MKRRSGLVTALVAALVLSSVAVAFAATTMGNPATARVFGSTWQNTFLVDTNAPAAHDGHIHAIEFHANRTGDTRFAIVSDDRVVRWISDLVSVETTGTHSVDLGAPVPVEAGDNLGVYWPGPSVVSFDVSPDAAPAYYRGDQAGLPAVGDTIVPVGSQGRIYSMNATVTPLEPASKDACKDGGWSLFAAREFRNQGACVSSVTADERAGKR